MRIKIFNLVDERDGKPPALDCTDGANKYRIRVWHAGAQYDLAVDDENNLVLREVDGRQIHLVPRASNEVRIKAEKLK